MRALLSKMCTSGAALVLALQLAGTPAAAAPVTFSAASLKGRWGFELLPAKSFSASAPGDPGGVAAAPRQNILRIGVITWDGVGSVTGNAVATTDDNAGNTVVVTYSFTGTYTVNLDGTGTLSITPTVADPGGCVPAQAPGVCPTFEGAETYAISLTRNRGLRLVQTDNVGGGAKVFLQGEALLQSRAAVPPIYTAYSLRRSWAISLSPATSFAANAPGDPGGVATAPRQDILRVGQINFNGFGVVAGHFIATTDDNTGRTVTINYSFAGAYTVNPDGTGTVSITPVGITDASCTPAVGTPALSPGDCATFEGAETYAMVIVPKRGRIYLVQTDNAGGGAKIFLAGSANFQ